MRGRDPRQTQLVLADSSENQLTAGQTLAVLFLIFISADAPHLRIGGDGAGARKIPPGTRNRNWLIRKFQRMATEVSMIEGN